MGATEDLADALRHSGPVRVIGGTVIEQTDGTHVRVSLGDKTVTAWTPGPLPVGATVRLLVGAGTCEVVSASTPWTAPTLGNSWVNFGAGVAPVAYRLLAGEVVVRGAMKSGTSALPAFTLPAGSRPTSGIRIFAVWADPGVARLDVNTAGEVIVRSYAASGTNAMVLLDGVRFSTT